MGLFFLRKSSGVVRNCVLLLLYVHVANTNEKIMTKCNLIHQRSSYKNYSKFFDVNKLNGN